MINNEGEVVGGGGGGGGGGEVELACVIERVPIRRGTIIKFLQKLGL